MTSISPAQCRAARGLLDWSQQDLASRAKVARRTVNDFEKGLIKPYPRTLRDILEAFDSAGVIFLCTGGDHEGPGVRLKIFRLAPQGT
jgi:transcriptional regulator with XRE-family HTH domain